MGPMAAAIWRHCPKYKSKIYYWEVPMCEWEMREWTVGSVLPKTSLSSCAPARQWYCHSPPRYTHICVLRSVLHSTQWWNCVSGIPFSGWVSLSICFSTFFSYCFLLFTQRLSSQSGSMSRCVRFAHILLKTNFLVFAHAIVRHLPK